MYINYNESKNNKLTTTTTREKQKSICKWKKTNESKTKAKQKRNTTKQQERNKETATKNIRKVKAKVRAPFTTTPPPLAHATPTTLLSLCQNVTNAKQQYFCYYCCHFTSPPSFRWSCPKRAAATAATTIDGICLCLHSLPRMVNPFCNTTAIRNHRQSLWLSAMGEVGCGVWYALPPGTWPWWACPHGTRRRRHTPRTMWRQSGKQRESYLWKECQKAQVGEYPVCRGKVNLPGYRRYRRFMVVVYKWPA